MDLDDAAAFLKDGDYQYVRFEQTDLHGLSRSKTVPVPHFRHFAENGLNFFGGLLGLDPQSGVAPGTGYMDERNFQDHLIWADLDTMAPIPWLPGTARVICEPAWYNGERAAAGPRFLLHRMLEQLNSAGYELRSAFEYEFYLVDLATHRPVFDGIQIFWSLRNEFDPAFIKYVLDSLRAAGIDIITSNAEYGPGQMEINYAPSAGIAGADQSFTFKNAIKEMALQERGGRRLMASFMTKPYADQSASGGHYHHSLLNRETGENIFFDGAAEDGLSEKARHWIGGQLAHAPALTAFLAPTVNCAKRYKLFSFAPMNATWGMEDRTAAVRVKGVRGSQTHIENRIGCAGANPYLAAAAIIAAGLDGLHQKIEPPPPTRQIAYADDAAPKLPTRLDESLQALEHDEALQRYLGDELIHLFLAVKSFEIENARQALPEYDTDDWPNRVTDRERETLFEVL